MCRIFGFRSVLQSRVHSSLVHAENALMQQSSLHPDGWGIAYYVDTSPHVVKATTSAIDDHLFRRVSGIVSSQTVVAHIRKSTVGENILLNTHPFQFGRWVFAHNGHVVDFQKHRSSLTKMILTPFRRFVLGDTDSEVIFFIILSEIERKLGVHAHTFTTLQLMGAVSTAIQKIIGVIGPMSNEDRSGTDANYLSFLISDGQIMIGHHGGKSLNFSTHKQQCPERDTCASFAPVCEAPAQQGQVNHLLFSSEHLVGENIWQPMSSGDLVGVDATMHLTRSRSI